MKEEILRIRLAKAVTFETMFSTMKQIEKEFPRTLYLLRKGMGLTQEQLAKQLEVSRRTLNIWERGYSLPRDEKIYLKLDEMLKGLCD